MNRPELWYFTHTFYEGGLDLHGPFADWDSCFAALKADLLIEIEGEEEREDIKDAANMVALEKLLADSPFLNSNIHSVSTPESQMLAELLLRH